MVGSSVGSLRGLTAPTAPCRSQDLPPSPVPLRSPVPGTSPRFPVLSSAHKDENRLRRSASGGCLAARSPARPPEAEGPLRPAPLPAARCGSRVRRRLQRFPYIRGCPGPVAGKRAERGILLPGFLLRVGCFALLKVPGLGKCFPFHSCPER